MCRRFMAVAVNVTGSSNESGPEAAGRSIGLMSGGVRQGATSTLPVRAVADIEVAAADAIDEPQFSVLVLGIGPL